MDKASETSAEFQQTATNINLLWGALFIEELIRNGIVDFCIAPGSRSTPLTLAIANAKNINTHLHFDERGLGFFAMGLSLAKKKPVVIITTSGSAVANLYPAVIEARQSNIPLIILSADRPPELIDCGANQAINQHNIFANYPVFFKQIPSPTLQIKPNYLLTTINSGIAKQKLSPSPIHFNIAFSEPLYPEKESTNYQQYLSPIKPWLTSHRPFTCYQQNQEVPPQHRNNQLSDKKVLIITANIADDKQAQAIAHFAMINQYPLLADIQSSQVSHRNNLNYYDLLLANTEFTNRLSNADIIIQFGDKLLSKRLNQFIGSFEGEYWLIEKGEERIDPNHRLDQRFNSEAMPWIASQTKLLTPIDKKWLVELTKYHQQIAQQIIEPFLNNNKLSEINVINCLDKLLLKDTSLFIGNSMPIRLCDMFMQHNQAKIYSNRGASGIDGLIATAIGVSKASQQLTTLLIGDTSFLYDLNSLALLKQLNHPFIIIVINNDGCSIFNLLPVPENQKRDFYQLPHGLNFSDICKQFAITYYQPKGLDDFEDNYQTASKSNLSLIEVCTENSQTYHQLEQLKEQIQDATF